MKYMDVKDLFKKIEDYENKDVVLEGWVRNNRNQSNFGFIDFKITFLIFQILNNILPSVSFAIIYFAFNFNKSKFSFSFGSIK